LTSSASKRKGTRFETRVVQYLSQWFPDTERRALAGAEDRGDIRGVPGWAIEAKDRRDLQLSRWCTEAAREALAARERYWAVVHNWARHPTPAVFCTIPLWALAELACGQQTAVESPECPDSGQRFHDTVWEYLEPCRFDPIQGRLGDWYLHLEPSLSLRLAQWVQTAARAAQGRPWAVVHRRRQSPVRETYVTTSLETWAAQVAAQVGRGQRPAEPVPAPLGGGALA